MTEAFDRVAYEAITLAVLAGAGVVFFGARGEPGWVTIAEVYQLVERGAVAVDVRPRGTGLIPRRGAAGAIELPARELPSRLAELPPDRPLLVYGSFGQDSAEPVAQMRAAGLDAHDLGPFNRYPKNLIGGAGGGHAHHEHDHDHDAHAAGRAAPQR